MAAYPAGTTKRGSSSVGRATASQAVGRGFEPRLPLKKSHHWVAFLHIQRAPKLPLFTPGQYLHPCSNSPKRQTHHCAFFSPLHPGQSRWRKPHEKDDHLSATRI